MRIGIIGAGAVASTRHCQSIKRAGGLECRWVYDRDSSRSGMLANQFSTACAAPSLDDVPEVDGVLIATPVGTRFDIWEKALEKRWSVFSEKPVAMSVSSLRDLINKAAELKLVLVTGFNRRLSQAANVLSLLSKKGYLKDLQAISVANCSIWSNTGVSGNWFVSSPELAGGGVLVETGSHLLDQLACAIQLESPAVQHFEMVSIENHTETVAAGSSTVCFEGRDIPLQFRFSVRDCAMNGIFLKLPNGYVHCDLSFQGNVCFRDQSMKKLFDFDFGNAGDLSVEQASDHQWKQFQHRFHDEVNGDVSEFERSLFAVDFVEKCYKLHSKSTKAV